MRGATNPGLCGFDSYYALKCLAVGMVDKPVLETGAVIAWEFESLAGYKIFSTWNLSKKFFFVPDLNINLPSGL